MNFGNATLLLQNNHFYVKKISNTAFKSLTNYIEPRHVISNKVAF